MISEDGKSFFVIDNSTGCYKKPVSSADYADFEGVGGLFGCSGNFPSLGETSQEDFVSSEDIVAGYNEIFDFFSKNTHKLSQAIIEGLLIEFEIEQKQNPSINIVTFDKFKTDIHNGILKGLEILKRGSPLSHMFPASCKECTALMEKNFNMLRS